MMTVMALGRPSVCVTMTVRLARVELIAFAASLLLRASPLRMCGSRFNLCSRMRCAFLVSLAVASCRAVKTSRLKQFTSHALAYFPSFPLEPSLYPVTTSIFNVVNLTLVVFLSVYHLVSNFYLQVRGIFCRCVAVLVLATSCS